MDNFDIFDNVDQELEKTITTTGTASVLVAERIDPGLRRHYEAASPLWNALTRKDHPFKKFEYRRVLSLPTTQTVAEGAVADKSDETYGKEEMEMKYFSTQGEVTGQADLFTRATLNLWAEKIALHNESMLRQIERDILTGSGSNGKITGLTTQIDNTNAVDAEGSPLTLGLLDEAQDAPAGAVPSHIVLNKAMGRHIWGLLQANQRFNDRIEVAGGFKVPTYNEKPILRLDDEAGEDLGAGTEASKGVVLLPDMNNITLAIARYPNFVRIAQQAADARGFFIQAYLCLAVEGVNRFHSKIVNVQNVASASSGGGAGGGGGDLED